MSVSGDLGVGLIRCTGRYDNISSIIKTPYFLYIQKEDGICYQKLIGIHVKNNI